MRLLSKFISPKIAPSTGRAVILRDIPIAAMNTAGLNGREKLFRIEGKNPISGQTAENHREADVRGRHRPEHPLLAVENGRIDVQTGNQTENHDRDGGESSQR